MFQLRDCADFSSKPRLNVCVARKVGMERLDGYSAPGRSEQLLRFVNGSHPPFAEFPYDSVLSAQGLEEKRVRVGLRLRLRAKRVPANLAEAL
jgi:hypothetical protein